MQYQLFTRGDFVALRCSQAFRKPLLPTFGSRVVLGMQQRPGSRVVARCYATSVPIPYDPVGRRSIVQQFHRRTHDTFHSNQIIEKYLQNTKLQTSRRRRSGPVCSDRHECDAFASYARNLNVARHSETDHFAPRQNPPAPW